MHKKGVMSIFFLALVVVGTLFVSPGTAADQDLAAQYAPILYYVHDEKCYPVDVSYTLDHSDLFVIGTPSALLTSPTAALLSNYTSDNYYLDNQQGTVAVGDNGIENDYKSKEMALGYKIYARVDAPNNVIQYWFFYAFNGGDLNRHEGDWEMVQVVLTNGQPTQVMFSQHHAGQKARWSQVDREGEHVKVYVARGSHANYIKPYSGKIGLASDTVGDDGKILRPADYTIEVLDAQPWLNFGGRWGWAGTNQSAAAEAALLGQAGPNGPKFREEGTMWQAQTWAAELQPANDMLFLLEWLVYHFVLLFLLFTLVSLILVIFFIYRRKKKYGLGPRLFSLLYIDGSNQKSIGNILCIVSLAMALLAIFSPWYIVAATVAVSPSLPPDTFNALSVDGINGIQIRLPNRSGPIPLGTVMIPFYLIIVIGLVFLVLSTIGVSQSKKLGKKYIYRGIQLLVPFMLILVFIMAVASIIPAISPPNIQGNSEMLSAMKAISAAPFNGQATIQTTDVEGGSIALQWGFGIGAYLLLFAGIILIMAGLMEFTAHEEFFQAKSSVYKKSETKDREEKGKKE